MGDIYKNAESTTIWLSKWDGHAGFAQVEPALDLLNYAEAHFGEPSVAKKFQSLFGGDEAGLFNALNALFQHPYWSRAWIIQEIILAKRIYVRCGTQQITWDALEFWSWNFINIYSAIGIPLVREHSSMYRGCVDEFFAQRSSQQRESDQFATLSKLIKRYREKLCKEPRDHIFSLISLVDPEKHSGGPMLAPNYRDPWTEVFFETLEFLQRESESLVAQTEYVELLLGVLYEREFSMAEPIASLVSASTLRNGRSSSATTQGQRPSYMMRRKIHKAHMGPQHCVSRFTTTGVMNKILRTWQMYYHTGRTFILILMESTLTNTPV